VAAADRAEVAVADEQRRARGGVEGRLGGRRQLRLVGELAAVLEPQALDPGERPRVDGLALGEAGAEQLRERVVVVGDEVGEVRVRLYALKDRGSAAAPPAQRSAQERLGAGDVALELGERVVGGARRLVGALARRTRRTRRRWR
jgi:hypothetical protein